MEDGNPWGGRELEFLTPDEWFSGTRGEGAYVWAPPPAAASVAVEMFAEARHKRPAGAHLLVIPRLMTSMWRKQCSKDADLIFEIPVGTSMWPASQHETLIVFVIFPFAQKKLGLRDSGWLREIDRPIPPNVKSPGALIPALTNHWNNMMTW